MHHIRPPGLIRGWPVLVGALAAAAASAEPPADAVLRGTVSGADLQTYRLVPFEVPEGATRIDVDFRYTTRDAHTAIDLGLLGPGGLRGEDGFRGWSGGNKSHFTLSATDATPSYLPGPIRPGQWSLLLGIPGIRPGTHAEYTAEVRFERGTRALPGPVLLQEGGWYRGDLHMHTAHSDGSCASHKGVRVPCPVFLTAQAARARGLDFIAITDHNTISQAAAIRELQPYFDDLLLIPGREVTTFQGHANLLGTVAPLDFRVAEGLADWATLVKRIAATGGVLSINHPVRPSGEPCMGCGWAPAGELDYHQVQAVEVVNGLDADTPFSGVPFWEQLLDHGYHLTAVGGSDSHDATRPAVSASQLREGRALDDPGYLQQLQAHSGAIGVPTTVVHATALSQEAILAGLRSGRVFIDVDGSGERTLDLEARAGQQSVHMGDTLTVRRGVSVRFMVHTSGVVAGDVQLVIDGHPVTWNGRLPDPGDYLWHADGRAHWARATVHDATGHTVLIGNPIYVEAEKGEPP
jgi:hypothetical protein